MSARIVIVLIALLLSCATSGAQQSGATDYRFYSAALDREMPYRVLMPANAGTSGRRYPVLYLLHGLDGHFNDWTDKTRIASYVQGRDLIVVMPEGGNSWYVNWHAGSSERWEDYLAKDLVVEVDARLPTDPRRESRFIAGLSMGGYGALRMGLKHPEQYALAASLSGAFDVTRRDTFGWTEPLREEFERTFGPIDSTRRREDDLLTLIAGVATTGLPFFYVDCGTADSLLRANRAVAAALQSRGIPYEYRETPGQHSWPYWDRQVVEVLDVVTRLRR